MSNATKAIAIVGNKIAKVPATEKETKNGKQAFREWRSNGYYANFFGSPEADKEYQFVMKPIKVGDTSPVSPSTHKLICINNGSPKRDLTNIDDVESSVVDVVAKPVDAKALALAKLLGY